jgi:hypothetical protein
VISPGGEMPQEQLPEWDRSLVDEMVDGAERRLMAERARAARRALQLAREQAYHRLAVAIDRPRGAQVRGQLSLWPTDPTLFDDAS